MMPTSVSLQSRWHGGKLKRMRTVEKFLLARTEVRVLKHCNLLLYTPHTSNHEKTMLNSCLTDSKHYSMVTVTSRMRHTKRMRTKTTAPCFCAQHPRAGRFNCSLGGWLSQRNLHPNCLPQMAARNGVSHFHHNPLFFSSTDTYWFP